MPPPCSQCWPWPCVGSESSLCPSASDAGDCRPLQVADRRRRGAVRAQWFALSKHEGAAVDAISRAVVSGRLSSSSTGKELEEAEGEPEQMQEGKENTARRFREDYDAELLGERLARDVFRLMSVGEYLALPSLLYFFQAIGVV